ncbi:class I SAM-dependent methyltransferase [Comamonas composti]|uniref:class I SAM-dependent methyltransferase n=1 Tax=Comamonas composti TaxID=408558 RepID=UPI0003F5D804|nr:class I SAM-dependent methyltransferase [Comamonas composti]
MPSHFEHPLQAFWNLAAAPLQAQALEQALEHDLFSQITPEATAQAMALRLGLNLAATSVWLDLLWSMGLLERQVSAHNPEPTYSASALATRFFLQGSADPCSQAWLYRNRFLSGLSTQWPSLLRQGFDPAQQVAQSVAPKGSWAQAAREQIGQEQRAITVPAVLRLLDTLAPLPQQGRLLDLGGGPGHVAIALAQRLPGWCGTVCDQPETAEVAREQIHAAGLSHRLDTLGCDLNHEAMGQGYDLIWCSSVLHFLREPQAAVRRMFEALNPGGLLLLAHAELADDPALAACVLPFYSGVMLRGNYLPRQGELGQMLMNAGFSDIKALGRVDFPMAPVWVHGGRRP